MLPQSPRSSTHFYPRPPGGGRPNFYPRPPGGGRPCPRRQYVYARDISIHALRVEGDANTLPFSRDVAISIHALRVEGDCGSFCACRLSFNFYPRPPGGGRLVPDGNMYTHAIFLSTPSGWRATPDLYIMQRGGWISIHALRVEGDGSATATRTAFTLFLSTPSGWRATWSAVCDRPGNRNFYPRPPGGGRPWYARAYVYVRGISIHALRVEGDPRPCSAKSLCGYFYPRPPGGGRQLLERLKNTVSKISIHALRVEGDKVLPAATANADQFLSTPSGWRATPLRLPRDGGHYISIHALRVEGDHFSSSARSSYSDFYPRPPGGGRLFRIMV